MTVKAVVMRIVALVARNRSQARLRPESDDSIRVPVMTFSPRF